MGTVCPQAIVTLVSGLKFRKRKFPLHAVNFDVIIIGAGIAGFISLGNDPQSYFTTQHTLNIPSLEGELYNISEAAIYSRGYSAFF